MNDNNDKLLLCNEWLHYELYLQAFLNAKLLQEFYATDGYVLWVEKINIERDN